MTRRFYGVYLANSSISTILDLVRFLGEPDAVRFSHLTLRGPYKAQLSKGWLEAINNNSQYRWTIEFLGLEKFFNERQSTVVIAVNLLSLQSLFHKKDYPGGLPHITLYDGKDRAFADAVYQVASTYDWRQKAPVTKLREIERNQKIDQTFAPFYDNFCRYFSGLIGEPSQIQQMRYVNPSHRLQLLDAILSKCVQPEVRSDQIHHLREGRFTEMAE